MNLPRRLAALAACVPHGSIVADIGTDHAFLPVYLVQSGICPMVIATDVNPGPFAAAEKVVMTYHLQDKIDLRCGDGLRVLQPGEAQVLIVAGMGGNTIRDILAAVPAMLNQFRRLILQPMVDAGDLRSWLVENGWLLADETLVEEDGRIYAVILAEPGTEQVRDPLLLELGPRLLEKRDPLLLVYLEEIIRRHQRVLSELARSSSTGTRRKARELEVKLAGIENIYIGFL
ncbi:MAG: SAM-dependent methyltransferase [Peptococcaceae bacterium]|nr:MAG: SAM-dependent methyltransferase [Peptococcaceae bacterium]